MNANLVKAALAVVFALTLAGCATIEANGSSGNGGARAELPAIDFGPSNGE